MLSRSTCLRQKDDKANISVMDVARRRCIVRDDHLHSRRRAEHHTSMPAMRKQWTIDEVHELNVATPSWPRYELLEGVLVVTPAPAWPHQIAITELLLLLEPYVERQGIGVAMPAPADVKALPNSITQPDVFVAKGPPFDANVELVFDGKNELHLVTEIISPSSVRTDRLKKRKHYMKARVPEYWVVDLDARAIERWRPGQRSPTIVNAELAWHPEGAREPLHIDLVRYFATVWRKWQLLGSPQRSLAIQRRTKKRGR